MADMEKDIQNEAEDLVDVFTLTDDETGEEQDFELRAEATIEGCRYFALAPLVEDSEEYVILKVTEEGDEPILESIDYDDEFERVEEYFNDLLFNEVDYDEN